MWCTDCQQDVPAVARSAREPLICSRCQSELAPAAAAPNDAGLALGSFDQSTKENLAPPIDWQAQEETRQRMRAIDRQLLRSYRGDLAVDTPRLREPAAPVPPLQVKATYQRPKREPKSSATSWPLSLLLGVGVLAFFVGVGLLAWSTAFQLPQLWQQGMTLTIGAEGLLILSLTWMAARLWRNSRRVNRQLHGVDQQLAKIEQVTGSLAGSQQASSQHFYHHASQAASPHMLVANLQGQVDQLAARL